MTYILPHTKAKKSSLSLAFKSAAQELSKAKHRKSCAQVASSVAPHVAPAVAHEVLPLSAGLRPIPHSKSKRSTSHGLRLRDGELDLIRLKARQFNMKVNAYIRAKALGEDYIEKPPEWLRDILLKLYVELAGQGNNLNQIARQVNRQMTSADIALAMAEKQRQPVFKVLEKLELALAGRRPPNDY